MTTTATPTPVDDLIPVPLHDVEAELAHQLQEEQDPGGPPILRARMSNLVIYSDRPDQTDRIAAEIPEIVAIHPAQEQSPGRKSSPSWPAAWKS